MDSEQQERIEELAMDVSSNVDWLERDVSQLYMIAGGSSASLGVVLDRMRGRAASIMFLIQDYQGTTGGPPASNLAAHRTMSGEEDAR